MQAIIAESVKVLRQPPFSLHKISLSILVLWEEPGLIYQPTPFTQFNMVSKEILSMPNIFCFHPPWLAQGASWYESLLFSAKLTISSRHLANALAIGFYPFDLKGAHDRAVKNFWKQFWLWLWTFHLCLRNLQDKQKLHFWKWECWVLFTNVLRTFT